MKYLFWITVIALVLFALRRSQGSRARRQPPPREAEAMVVCSQCGVNQPRSESLLIKGRYYCCPAHAAEQDND